ncbi:L-dopachrome tautomerase-related protein [Kiloniella majae]|uniref:L-dopachrome tautomerase-related protein n=1 Tax=Kiloniella majae TaxID=1938558 RepID=UPI000A2789AF|nr:L-dopachrome tautomerase-related protein [Kiloniella majae]
MKSILIAMLACSTAISALNITSTLAEEVTETVASFDIRPGNPSITPDGRILVTIHPLIHPSTKLVEVTKSGKKKAFPTEEIAVGDTSKLKAPLSVRTDDAGVAWILDLGNKNILGWDTKSNSLVKEIQIPDGVLQPTSFLQDFALDQKRNRIIIADMTQGDLKSAAIPAFVSVDLETGKARRVAESHQALMPEKEGGFALNPITIDPDYQWVYFGAMHGRKLYRVPAESFDGNAENVGNSIELYGPKPFSDGITVDTAGNVYITDIEESAIGVTNNSSYKVLSHLPENQSWPDGMAFGPDGYVYATVNQLDRTAALNNGIEAGSGEYKLVRVKALAKGTTGR